MKLKEILVESTNAHLVKDLEKAFIDGFRETISDNLELMEIKFERFPDYLKSYSWPKTVDEVFYSDSLLSGFSNTFSGAMSRIPTKELLEKFGITKPVSISSNSRMGEGSAALDSGNPNLLKLMYSPKSIESFDDILASKLLTLKKPTKTTFKKWVVAVKNLADDALSEVRKNSKFKNLLQILIHELTHATQDSKRKIDVDDTVNVFGHKFLDVYIQKIQRGIHDKDYYGSFDEIDAYANGAATKIIQDADGEIIDVSKLESQITHPAYDIFKQISKEADSAETRQFKKAWQRFVKRVVQNVNTYNERILADSK